MSKSQQIFDLFNQARSLSAQADGLDLPEIQALLNYATDRLVIEYHKNADGAAEEANELVWNEEKWPSATAVLLEMKSMIFHMENAQRGDGAPPKLSNYNK